MANTSMRRQFPDTVEINGHKGKHIGNGIYKLKHPVRINIDVWTADKTYTGYAIAANNYSEDCCECSIIYFTQTAYNSLSELVAKLNKEKNTDEYGYIINMNIPKKTMTLGGGLLIEI